MMAKATRKSVRSKGAAIARTIVLNPMALYRAPDLTRHHLIKAGVDSEVVGEYAKKMRVSKRFLREMLNLHRRYQGKSLRQGEAERVVGLATLLGNVMDLSVDGGNSFDAYRWLADWLTRPVPALGDAAPAQFMDTMTGQRVVANLFEMARSGAYA